MKPEPYYRRLEFPLRTSPGGNNREHWRVRNARVKNERTVTAWNLAAVPRPDLPVVVTLTRYAPSNGLDDDNLRQSLKAIRDQVAEWLGVDDRDRRVLWEYAQARAPWSVAIAIGAIAK